MNGGNRTNGHLVYVGIGHCGKRHVKFTTKPILILQLLRSIFLNSCNIQCYFCYRDTKETGHWCIVLVPTAVYVANRDNFGGNGDMRTGMCTFFVEA